MIASKRTVGILGGMGPEATILLMQMVVAAVDAKDDSDHIPLLVDQNPQVPSRIKRLIDGTGKDPAPVLIHMARRLEAAGAEALAIPCNTAHYYSETIRKSVSIPLIDMVALSAQRALDVAGKGARIGILASPAVRKVGIFDTALEKHGLTAIYASREDMTLRAIQSLKSQGPNDEARRALSAATAEMFEFGAKAQIIACTEFSLIADAVAPACRAFDALEILASAVVDFSNSSG